MAVILSKIFFKTKFLHAYIQFVYIVQVNYQIAISKAVVEVNRYLKALSMHIHKPYKGKIVHVFIAVILSKIIL